MDTLTKSWVDATKNAITSVYNNYKTNRGMLLTEGDLECHLFHELMQQPSISGYHSSKSDTKHNQFRGEDYKTGFVHSQVTWFKPGEKSGYEVDLTISDPKKIEVINLELFEKYTSKGFAYDGECVAIELKFIRDAAKVSSLTHEDFLKLRDKLIPDKLKNIKDEMYKVSNTGNVAFMTIVGCKNKDIFEAAKKYLGKHLCDISKPCPENLFICLFCQEDIIWDNEKFIEAYKMAEINYNRTKL